MYRLESQSNFKTIILMIMVMILFACGNIPSEQRTPDEAVDPAIWIGDYTFTESDGDGTLQYTVKVYGEAEELKANLDIEGPQITARLEADAEANGDRLNFYLTGYREGNRFEGFEDDVLLLTFDMTDNKMLTYWGAIEPQYEPVIDGQVQFVKE